MKAQLNPCKTCKKCYDEEYVPNVKVERMAFDIGATVACSCGTRVLLAVPVLGNESDSEMKAKYDMVEQVAALAWNTLNV